MLTYFRSGRSGRSEAKVYDYSDACAFVGDLGGGGFGNQSVGHNAIATQTRGEYTHLQRGRLGDMSR